MTRPTVELAVDRSPSPTLMLVATSLRRHARLRMGPVQDAVATLATSPAASSRGPEPRAAWYEPGDDVGGFSGLLLYRRGITALLPGLAVFEGVDVAGRRSLTPFVRARWRQREGLPEELVVVADPEGARVAGGPELPRSAMGASLALAAAVVATGGSLAEALAWGAPTLTTSSDARRLGLTSDVHVGVADDADDAVERAKRLARDWHRASAMGRAGRRFAEKNLDSGIWLRPLVGHLGLQSRRSRAVEALEVRMDELGAPHGAPIGDRAAAAVAGWR